VLDRLVGYKLSPLLWEKIRRGLSAGRVQSVAVRLITEREREIAAFVPVEYWSLHARLKGKNPPDFTATLKEVGGQKADLPNEAATLAVMTGLHGAAWTVKAVTRGERRRNPAPPFITSTLQQDASRKLHFSAKKTMMVAQQLYEGVELGEEGAVGLITYMRTDAVRVAAEAQEEARQWVTGRLGREYLPEAPPTYKAKKSAQEAHEAVRPSSVAREPKAVARFLSRDQLALYRIIWERFLASQMLPAVYDTVAADIEAGDCLFRAQGSTLKFPGFTAVYVESREATDEAPEEEAEAVVPPLVGAFKPDALVIQLGIDSHRTDPLTHLSLTVQGFTRAVRRLLSLAPRVVALGGGGYDLANVARAWTAAWAAMNDVALPEALPRQCHRDMERLGLATLTLSDPVETLPEDTRRWAEEYARRQVGEIHDKIFPLHGL